jgi:hypothetical protein
VMSIQPKTESKYLLAEMVIKFSKRFKLNTFDSRRIRTLSNFKIIPVIISNLIKLLIRKRHI